MIDDEQHEGPQRLGNGSALPRAPAESKAESARTPSLSTKTRRLSGLRIARGVLVGLAVAASAGAYGVHRLSVEDTEDAQIDGDVSAVSPRATGAGRSVYVIDNQVIHAGDVLAELDPIDYDAAVTQARANLAETEAQLAAESPKVPITETTNRTTLSTTRLDAATRAAEAVGVEEYKQTRSQLAQDEANLTLAKNESKDSAAPPARGSVAQADYDQLDMGSNQNSTIVSPIPIELIQPRLAAPVPMSTTVVTHVAPPPAAELTAPASARSPDVVAASAVADRSPVNGQASPSPRASTGTA